MNIENRHFLRLIRLRVLCKGKAVYDQTFHEGVNIIRGQNGSGKSTIADFIFFALGGEFDDWKDAAKKCDEVQAEIKTKTGTITIKRLTSSKTAPMHVFFGDMVKASKSSLEGWEQFPFRRGEKQQSFSQIMFPMIGIPEAKGEGSSNITMHQILRLCYSDQRSPATRIFRFESFDTQNIREAVGGLLCGYSNYETYELELALREKNKVLSDLTTKHSGLLKALPSDVSLQSTQSISSKIRELDIEKDELLGKLSNIDELVTDAETSEHLKSRKVAIESIRKSKSKLAKIEDMIYALKLEIEDLERYQKYIADSLEKLNQTAKTFSAIGDIEFTHCPSCGKELKNKAPENHCSLCKSEIDLQVEKERYNLIRLDYELQTRETKQILNKKLSKLAELDREIKVARQEFKNIFSYFQLNFSQSNSPRDTVISKLSSRIGYIERESSHLTDSLNVAGELEKSQLAIDKLKGDISKSNDRLKSLKGQSIKRKQEAMLKISDIAVELLHSDFDRQEEFEASKTVELNFHDDAIMVDGKINFAESSNVFLKNSAILSMLLAAAEDQKFFHPMFLLIDNIEDKGMEQERSHLFQELIVRYATCIKPQYQIIFTTSMMNKQLELEEYVIGPAYTSTNKTLDFNFKTGVTPAESVDV